MRGIQGPCMIPCAFWCGVYPLACSTALQILCVCGQCAASDLVKELQCTLIQPYPAPLIAAVSYCSALRVFVSTAVHFGALLGPAGQNALAYWVKCWLPCQIAGAVAPGACVRVSNLLYRLLQALWPERGRPRHVLYQPRREQRRATALRAESEADSTRKCIPRACKRHPYLQQAPGAMNHGTHVAVA